MPTATVGVTASPTNHRSRQVQRLLRPLLSAALRILRPGGRIVFLYPGFVRPSDTNSHSPILKPDPSTIINTDLHKKVPVTSIPSSQSHIHSQSTSKTVAACSCAHVRKLLLQPEWLWLVEWEGKGLILAAKFTQTFANIVRHCVCLVKT